MKISLNTLLLLLTIFICSIKYANSDNSQNNWAVTFELGQTSYDFRGARDNSQVVGLKIERFFGPYVSSYISYHDTTAFTLLDVPRFEVDSNVIKGVTVSGHYSDFSIGLSGHYAYKALVLTASIGLTEQRVTGMAKLPDFPEFSISDGDNSLFYGVGIEIPVTEQLFLNLELRNNKLFSDSKISRSVVGLEYRF